MKKLPKELPEGEVLKVTPGKEILVNVYITTILSFIFVLASFFHTSFSLVFHPAMVFFWSIPGALLVRIWIAYGRTFTFCQKGIFVKFFGFTRFYAWEELKTKRLFDCRKSFGYKSSYSFGAEFSRSEKKRPQWIKPDTYSFLIHPFAYIYVTFDPQKEDGYPVPYHVDESTFRRLMAEWNVFDEDTRPN